MTPGPLLPNEAGAGDFCFADATAHNLALKVEGWGTMFASIQWRHDGFHFAGSTSDGPFFPSLSFGGLTRLHTIKTHTSSASRMLRRRRPMASAESTPSSLVRYS